MKVIKAHELAADETARAQNSETSRLRPGNHVELRLTKAESQAEGKLSPLFKGPYVIVNVKPAGVTANIRCLATGHMATVNRCRLKFLEAIAQQALHLKHLPRAVFRYVLRSSPPGGAGDRCRRADSAGLACALSAAPEKSAVPEPCLGLGI